MQQPSKCDSSDDGKTAQLSTSAPYTILSERAKKGTILIVATINASAFFANTTYYPALNSISEDLNVSSSKMYLTITSYMVRRHDSELTSEIASNSMPDHARYSSHCHGKPFRSEG